MSRVLIVVDMQNDFIDGSLGTPEAMGIVAAAAQKIRDFDGTVLYTLDTHDAGYLHSREGSCLPVEHCVKGSGGWQLNPEIAAACAARQAKGLEKPGFGAMNLPEFIRERCPEVTGIELIGLCTDICVISNAIICRAAFTELPVAVDAACCAGVTPEAHERALAAMKSCQIEILQ